MALGAVAHTKTAYVEVISATTDQVEWLDIRIQTDFHVSAGDSALLLDIAIGGSGAEVVKIADIALGYLGPGGHVLLPLSVPVGSRISVRAQAVRTTTNYVFTMTFRGPTPGRASPSSLVTLGTNAAASRGTSLTYAGSTNTKGAWATIGTPTIPLQGLIVLSGGAGDTTLGDTGVKVDIGIGAGPTIIIPDVHYLTTSAEVVNPFEVFWPYPVVVPAGAALSARYDTGSGSNGAWDVTLIGIPVT